jgi:hypothetical protein
MHIDWAAVWDAILKELAAIYHTLGFGGGALALQLLRFMPAPFESQVLWGWMMDAMWTVAGQNRAGERRTRDGKLVGANRGGKTPGETASEKTGAIVIQETR